MNNYLSIVRGDEFSDLFKYGHLLIHNVVAFDGNIKRGDRRLFNEVTSCMNIFEYATEYVMIHFHSEENCSPDIANVNIEDVVAVYALEKEAIDMFNFDYRIEIKASPWNLWFKQLKLDMLIGQGYKGVDNVWKIFGLTAEDKSKCEEIISGDIIEEVFQELFYYRRPTGSLPIWVYLLRYERHSSYPRKAMKSYFCDLIHVVFNEYEGMEQDGEVAFNSNVYKNLKEVDDFKGHVESIANSKLASETRKATGCDFYIVAPLFLYMKDIFKEGMHRDTMLDDKPFDEFVASYKKQYGFSFSLAAYLLGVTLGHNGTYDCLYDVEQLKIFKKPEPPKEPSIEKMPEKKPGTEQKSGEADKGYNGDLFPPYGQTDGQGIEKGDNKIIDYNESPKVPQERTYYNNKKNYKTGHKGTAGGYKRTAGAGYKGTADAGYKGTAGGYKGAADAGYKDTADAGYKGAADAGYKGTADVDAKEAATNTEAAKTAGGTTISEGNLNKE